eukprot:gnl/Dysnectes_brevis/2289_a2690_2210.p1 GENE.gnl/Dysnectes_brevis/2289_a2690_2210~~gnl/Dysnectes_brevis/2289_a2690_2210.p1  ORF type:complete len:154 (+),score=6.44 gnl/Dysnectes_brevis/2289_a2690_2210:68-463(+)
MSDSSSVSSTSSPLPDYLEVKSIAEHLLSNPSTSSSVPHIVVKPSFTEVHSTSLPLLQSFLDQVKASSHDTQMTEPLEPTIIKVDSDQHIDGTSTVMPPPNEGDVMMNVFPGVFEIHEPVNEDTIIIPTSK